jgi:hypothetical protein
VALGRLTGWNERRMRWYEWDVSIVRATRHPFAPVDELPVSEILPGLYRAVLDAVADLEARGRRADAAAIRRDATRVYSRAWTADAAKRLRNLRTRADRIKVGKHAHTRYELVVETLGRNADLERRTV